MRVEGLGEIRQDLPVLVGLGGVELLQAALEVVRGHPHALRRPVLDGRPQVVFLVHERLQDGKGSWRALGRSLVNHRHN